MIMMADKKKTINQILGEPKGKEEEDKGEGESSALHVCVKEFFDAVKADDVESGVAALRSCYAELESEEGPEEEGE
jgi:ribosomal protein S20